jgi:uncharacterized protein (TIGR00299 family) protein
MKTLYLDLFSGISGDMFIGALLDLGVDAHQLEKELKKLPVSGYHLHVARKQKSSISGTKFDVHLEDDHDAHHHSHDHAHEHEHHHEPGHHHEHEHDHPHSHSHHHTHSEPGSHSHSHDHERTFAQIKSLIAGSSLSEWVKTKSVAIFKRIAIAEGKIHGLPADQVHFHEVGAVDSIVDIVGGCIGLELLGKPRLLASHVVEGNGWVDCAHGRFPIPAPATLEILGARGIAVSQCNEPHELVTPTGAALLAELVESFGPMNELVAERIGFGLGTRDNKTRPNVLRAILGNASEQSRAHDWETDCIAVLETNLDDINSEILGNFVELALAAGALDVFHTPIQMKKNRPGVMLTLLCETDKADKFTELLLTETTSFGVRRYLTERRKLARTFRQVQTSYGSVTVKLGMLDGRTVQAAPEFESCKKAAVSANVPLKTVYDEASRACSELLREPRS